MTRRPVLPGASELFRRTDTASPAPSAPVTELPTLAAAASSSALRGKRGDTDAGLSLVPGGAPDELAGLRDRAPRVAAPTGPPRRGRPVAERTKHDEKITVYCSADELMALEKARLALRGEFGVVADRGRIVRTAVALLVADLEAHGEDSVLVRRLREG